MSEQDALVPAMRWPVAHEVTEWANEHVEDVRWIGKPWRRLELFINRHYWKGELVERSWTASLTVGLRRLGWTLQFSLTRDRVQDYSEERQ